MGGRESSGFMAPAESGENILSAARTATTTPTTKRRAVSRGRPRFPDPLEHPEEVETPGATTIEALAEFLDIDPAATSKAMPVIVRRAARARA